MFRIADALGRTIRSADTNQIITVINPSRAIKVISSGHVDSVTAGYSTNAAVSATEADTAKIASEAARDLAEGYKDNAQTSADQAALSATAAGVAQSASEAARDAAAASVASAGTIQSQAQSTYDLATFLNTLVTSSVGDASASATSASSSSTAAAASATLAGTHKDDASKLAITPLDTPYTLSDSSTGYSALHYATRAEVASTAATGVQSTLDSTLSAAQSAAALAAQATIDAQNAINQIAGSHNDFHLKYLGDFTADPTTGPNLATLEPGDLYYNTANQVMRIYTTSSGWVDQVTSTTPVVKKTYIYEVPATPSHSFSGSDITGKTLTFTEDNIEVYINGALVREDEYSADPATNTVTINTDISLTEDDNVLITVLQPFALSDVITKSNGGTYAGAVTFTSPTTFNGNLDVNANVDIDGHVHVSSTGSPLMLNRDHSTSLINQEHSVASISGNDALRGDLGIQHDQLYIQSRGNAADSKAAGLQFRSTDILPRHNGALNDGGVDLGTSTNKFGTLYADNIVVNGRDSNIDGLIPLYDTDNDLNYRVTHGIRRLRMPAITAGTNITVEKTNDTTTLNCQDFRLLAAGFYRPPAQQSTEHVLLPDIWHAAVINDWAFQHPEYLSRITAPVSAGFSVPLDRRCFIEFGASMGFAKAHSDVNLRDEDGPVVTQGPLRLRLGCPTLLASNQYEVSHANGYTTDGNYQQLYASYITPASLGYTEFRIEGRWPFGAEGSWSREVIAGQDIHPYGPRVAWVRIWDTEVRNNP